MENKNIETLKRRILEAAKENERYPLHQSNDPGATKIYRPNKDPEHPFYMRSWKKIGYIIMEFIWSNHLSIEVKDEDDYDVIYINQTPLLCSQYAGMDVRYYWPYRNPVIIEKLVELLQKNIPA